MLLLNFFSAYNPYSSQCNKRPGPSFPEYFGNTLYKGAMKRFRLSFACSLLFVSLVIAAQVVPAQSPVAPQKPPTFLFRKDMTVYVSDFDLDAQDVQVDQGSGVSHLRPGILERPGKKEKRDPEAQAKKLVDTMSQSIVSDLHKAGYKAQRLGNDDPKPTSGAWLHGVFTQVDEGNRRQRAIIGFGAGDVKMDLYVTLSNLASPQKPLYEAAKENTSKNMPGAVITLNPYVAAAKFVVEKNAPEKTIKSTASEISKEVVSHLQQPEGTPALP
ncbi:DUF4410 domain-containing protein [Tunturiibacter gelidoferens]|uniref:DUF4410 domain-containing protein n=1 Tax=Tunturiibacter gelidiferens TaxID=3069689 RepID=A0A9X0U3Y7_9BACT|nr:DUF4410 domain-containing protein [Edaphobacter lichenicola]MBB5328778.1 hypothetical protein [Edaphobacter lichenicola]